MTDAPLDTTVAIEAPEHIRFRYRLAGPVQRAVAHLIDLAAIVGIAVVLILLAVFANIATPLRGEALGKAEIGFALLALFVLQWGYFALFESLARGQTLGKRAISLRVVKTGGEPIGFVDAVLRNLLRAADWLPIGYAVGLTSMLIDGRFRRLGDLVAGTMVVVEDRIKVAVPIVIYPPSPQEQAALPPRVILAADELRAIEMFLRRASDLGAALATELAMRIAEPLGKKYGFYHPDPVRLLALLYLRATAPTVSRGPYGSSQVPTTPPMQGYA
jgi:uncharacterized RDD family membrane protein YckC